MACPSATPSGLFPTKTGYRLAMRRRSIQASRSRCGFSVLDSLAAGFHIARSLLSLLIRISQLSPQVDLYSLSDTLHSMHLVWGLLLLPKSRRKVESHKMRSVRSRRQEVLRIRTMYVGPLLSEYGDSQRETPLHGASRCLFPAFLFQSARLTRIRF